MSAEMPSATDRLQDKVDELRQKVLKLEEESLKWARLVSKLREELNTQDGIIEKLTVIKSTREGVST